MDEVIKRLMERGFTYGEADKIFRCQSDIINVLLTSSDSNVTGVCIDVGEVVTYSEEEYDFTCTLEQAKQVIINLTNNSNDYKNGLDFVREEIESLIDNN